MITVTNLKFLPIIVSLKTFSILHSVIKFILTKPPEDSFTKMFEFFKNAFFKATYLTTEFQIKHLILRGKINFHLFNSSISMFFSDAYSFYLVGIVEGKRYIRSSANLLQTWTKARSYFQKLGGDLVTVEIFNTKLQR